MVYVDIPFPSRITFGAQRRAGWSTALVVTAGGFEATNQNWSKVRHRFDVGLAVRNADDFDLVMQHFHSMRGRAKKFPFLDPLDNTADVTRGVLLTTAGSAYQLAKRYGTGADAYYRTITRPRSGTVTFQRTRTGTSTDITGAATLDVATGLVTFTGGTVVGGDVLAWAGGFYVPCRYDIDELPEVVIDRQGPGGLLLVQCEGIPIVEVRE